MSMDGATIDLLILLAVLVGGILGVVLGAVRVAGPLALGVAIGTLLRVYPKVSGLFGGDPPVQLFLYVLLGFVFVVVLGFVTRILHAGVRAGGLGFLNHLGGTLLGLILGSLLAGGMVWGIEAYGTAGLRILLRSSKLAGPVLELFNLVMGFTERLFPVLETRKDPWWRRALW